MTNYIIVVAFLGIRITPEIDRSLREDTDNPEGLDVVPMGFGKYGDPLGFYLGKTLGQFATPGDIWTSFDLEKIPEAREQLKKAFRRRGIPGEPQVFLTQYSETAVLFG